MRIVKWEISHSSLLLLLAAFSHVPFAAHAVGPPIADPSEGLAPGQQAQILPQVEDAKRSPPGRDSNGIQWDSTLVRDINSNHALLERQTRRIKDKLARLKHAGHLDRRTKRNIECSLREACSVMSRLERAIESGELGKWDARNIAQELNHAGDVLDASLIEWQKNLGVTGEGVPEADSEERKASQECRQLVQDVSNISRMLHDIGQAIVRHSQ